MKNTLILLTTLLFSLLSFAQSPANKLWHLEANSKKGNSGIGLEEAQEMMKGKSAITVIVAIIDAGVDIAHPDLKNMLWSNHNEKASNGIDDDNNGYIDDVYGWNFIGETTFDNLEITRQYKKLNEKYELKPESSITDKEEYNRYLAIKEEYLKEYEESKQYFEMFDMVMKGSEILEKKYGTDMTKEELKDHKANSKVEIIAKIMIKASSIGSSFDFPTVKKDLQEAFDHFDYIYNYGYNTDFTPPVSEKGNNEVYSGERFSSHGTHVAGIVGADASNDIGAQGICQTCPIMSIRTVPEGDERDRDVALSIRYAVDNGAKVLNMSFGKSYANNIQLVKDAIKYAEKHNVLLVHAAGNDSKNNDKNGNFPNDSKDAVNNWLEVGASSWMKKPKAFAEFSNYGLNEVDLFAPGKDIYSTTPENNYEAFDGTSMASPVVAGVAAYVWSYYPSLTAAQLKQLLIKSSIPIKGRNRRPGTKKKTKASKISLSGGEVNLPAALRMAAEMTSK